MVASELEMQGMGGGGTDLELQAWVLPLSLSLESEEGVTVPQQLSSPRHKKSLRKKS